MFPRGGGIWDQDPMLLRDFRIIRKFESEWKQTQAAQEHGQSVLSGGEGGSVAGIGDALNSYIQHLEEDDAY